MVLATIFFLTLGVSIGFAVLGILYENSFKTENSFGIYLSITGFLLLLILGLTMVAGTGLEYKTGTTTIQNNQYNNTTLTNFSNVQTNNYTEYTGSMAWLLSFILLLTGLAGIIGNIVYFQDKQQSFEENIEYD